MSHRVPDLDANHGGSIGFNHLDNLDIRSGKGDAGSVAFSHRDHSAVCSERDEGYQPQHRKQASVHVPENVFNHIPWMERESEKKNKHACSMGRESVPALEVPLSHLLFQDDEMLSWLQYPLEDSFDKNYCSEPIFEQALNAPSHNAHDRFSSRTLREGEKLPAIGLPSQPAELSHSNMGGRTLTSDVAMAMGAFRVAGVLPQAGGEAFHRVHTTGQPSDPRETYEAPPPKATDALHVPSNAMDIQSALTLRSQYIAKQSALNFSLFSRPVAATKTSLQILGTSSGPSNIEKTSKPFITHGNEGLSFSATEFTAAASLSGLSSPVESDLSHQSKGKKQKTNCTSQRKCLPPMLSFGYENNAGKEKVELSTHFKMSAGIGSETLETVDVTLTSPSGGSGNSSEKSVKEIAASSCKRKSCPAEESECESKDAEEVAASEKQPASGRPSPAKRTRAAEIHNQSERKRRNKINDRMKALQELIPNANKTDKASMLDEAIEYVKTLQAQLQLMSMRTGMVLPSVMTSPGMQYPSIQQRLVSSHMNMGMGVSMGLAMGMGMLDASATGVCAGRAVVTMPPFLGQRVPGPAYHVAGYQPSGSSSIVHEAQGHMHINEGHSLLSTHQLQPLHLNMQISSDMRRAFMQQHQTQENFTSKEP